MVASAYAPLRQHPEGFVIYYRGAPLCKIKNKRYLEKHGLCTGDLLYQRNIVIGQFFERTLDDIYDVFSPHIQVQTRTPTVVTAAFDAGDSDRRSWRSCGRR